MADHEHTGPACGEAAGVASGQPTTSTTAETGDQQGYHPEGACQERMSLCIPALRNSTVCPARNRNIFAWVWTVGKMFHAGSLLAWGLVMGTALAQHNPVQWSSPRESILSEQWCTVSF